MTSQTMNPLPPEAGRLRDAGLADELSFLLARANALSLSAGNIALSAHGLRVRSYSVLALAASGGRPTQREMAEFLRLDPSQVVALVDELQSKGLAIRKPDPRDRRANVVVATTEGVRVYEIARHAARAAEDRLYSGIDDQSRAKLASVLREVAFPSAD